MILVFGGAYQGKLDYVLANYGNALSVFSCTPSCPTLDFSKDIFHSFHLFILAKIKEATDPLPWILENLSSLHHKIIICDDISSGIVPLDPEARLWREATGRCMTLLAAHSEEVVRVFCGIGIKI